MRQRQHRANPPGRATRLAALGLLAIMLALLLMGFAQASANDNLRFDGALVAEPCELDPKTTDIALDFGPVVDKYLYLNIRTPSKPVTIRLLGCDLSLGKTVSLTFSGSVSPELPGLLALTKGTAGGIAIGMELPDGSPLPLNKATPLLTLMAGGTTLTLMNYVQGEPVALKNHGIVSGDFSAVATFTLTYQ
ncbi:fimbrial protein [Serratia proteamaculans]|uniref:fimbrial protein n=1 Tax=Serratia proteamaculans TaxID=28151 RepID=UPI0021A428CA|nr:fimbrial protein [Serratia proteamaculans]WEO90656.1 fimbrial protein [Serratia proteamaculans]